MTGRIREAQVRSLRAQIARDQIGRSQPSPWRSRGYLPHFDQPQLIQSVTFRLFDSLPRKVIQEYEKALATLSEKDRQVEMEKRIAILLDKGHGSSYLREPRTAEIVEEALLFFDAGRYRLLCWCIMPNHVHAMVEVSPDHPLQRILHSWKSFTSKEVNKILCRTGQLWQEEYHDRFIRDDDHYANTLRYIAENPVKAGLVTRADDWRWSSAWKGRNETTSAAGS